MGVIVSLGKGTTAVDQDIVERFVAGEMLNNVIKQFSKPVKILSPVSRDGDSFTVDVDGDAFVFIGKVISEPKYNNHKNPEKAAVAQVLQRVKSIDASKKVAVVFNKHISRASVRLLSARNVSVMSEAA